MSGEPGSVSYVVSHLAAWIARGRSGIVWVDFWADATRDRAIEQVNEICGAAHIPAERVTVKEAFSRRHWEQARDQVESKSGVVHVLFPALFDEDSLDPARFRDFALALNLDRERIFSANASQIWWLSRPFAIMIRPLAPDFVSWVHLRFTLDEVPVVLTEFKLSPEFMEPAAISAEAISQPLPDDPRFSHLRELLEQADDFVKAGKLTEALSAAREAAYGFRQESSLGPAAQDGLASSLDALAQIQARLGQRQQALVSSAEVVRVCRALADANPGSFLPRLAASLNNQANRQSDMGQRAAALASIVEAVRYYRALAEANPAAFLSELALSLNNQSALQSEMEQRAEALTSITESVRYYRALAEAKPAVFLPNLAGSLNNQANCQSAMGQRAEALVSIAEAVRTRRALADADPAAFLLDLAISLNNQAQLQNATGRHAEALDSISEAVSYLRALEKAGMEAALPNLAMSLNTQASSQGALGQVVEALVSIAEAVRHYRVLAEAHADAFLPYLAGSLNNQANSQRALGQHAEALASIAEAVRYYRSLAHANPHAFLPNLARSLSVRGHCLAALGRLSEARNSARESLAILAQFYDRLPGVFDDLAKATLRDYILRTEELGEEPDPEVLNPYLHLLKTAEPPAPQKS